MTLDDTVADVYGGRPASLLNGRYVLGRRLGSGGMADVYEADDQMLSRSVAIKVFRVDTSPEERGRIDGEMRTLASLRHPGLVTVFDAGSAVIKSDQDDESERMPFLIMELITGPTLRQHLHTSPLTGVHAASLGRELAGSLDYVHERGIVHRDVKPANILLDPQPSAVAGYRTKLADFGISRALTDDRVTMHGHTVGTANYLSPEQAQGLDVGPASDVYSLGLVLIECLTGMVVYPGSGVEAAILRLHNAPKIPTALGPRWHALLTAMTHAEPEARPCAGDVERELAALLDSPSERTSPNDSRAAADVVSSSTPTNVIGDLPADSTAVLPHLPVSRPRTWVRAAIGAAAVLAVVFAVVIISSSGGTIRPSPKVVYPTVTGPLGSDVSHLASDLP